MIEHPDHRVPADIREALDRRHQYQLQAAAARFKFAERLRPDRPGAQGQDGAARDCRTCPWHRRGQVPHSGGQPV